VLQLHGTAAVLVVSAVAVVPPRPRAESVHQSPQPELRSSIEIISATFNREARTWRRDMALLSLKGLPCVLVGFNRISQVLLVEPHVLGRAARPRPLATHVDKTQVSSKHAAAESFSRSCAAVSASLKAAVICTASALSALSPTPAA
jgi:hypothetical protein